ncbi:Aldo/keto reductase [Chitinophaga terrae (ex Kim and Jung 2007)]|uniref:Aldo/keto reductase n=1 Tax=Chitinophaga terrae (ex Kim and Jung 2007) TaxID=408074 RepID=A0A1H3ZCG7_9BACT|nr:aldo/keto reductase [Chitinophaga terrae (ex Kim and Jung 2007)]MDQ0109236.1 diketogulonate reductase-like aldo/keto reductase [Chitinophaga terrae (ex Kim and Jung 2007)]GEP88666.1 glyoxal reductase [Chitinophaga terrae (ex Kim and Jung 2007)]SEA21042.1 Aldo/keto reductase [Chitinophaga terrae (ex Kim and Jung 2007)]
MQITDINGTVTLANGVKMPYFGLGVFKTKEGKEVIDSVTYALDAGYRHIDTAAIYQNEEGVGLAIEQNKTNRKDIFLTSKVWNADQGYDSTLKAFDTSLQKLKTTYLDLYLIHWPVKGKYKDTWKALEKLYADGRVKAIGVSNFLQPHLEDLLQSADVVPMVNQLEFHPYLVQQPLLDFCNQHKIQYEAWSPLMQGKIFEIPLLKELAEKYKVTIPQLVLRWDLQKGVVTIPKSIRQDRIISNAGLWNFEISEEDVDKISSLDRGERIGPDPANFNF